MGEMGEIGKIGKIGKMGKIPKNAKNAKNGEIGDFTQIPKNGILATTIANTHHRLDMIIIFKITPGYPFYTLLLRVSILHYL